MTRRNISKAEKQGFELKELNSESGIEAFYKLYVSTRKNIGLPPQPYRFFSLLCNYLFSSNKGTILMVEHQNTYIAGGIFLSHNNRFSNDYEAWDRKFSSLRPNYFLYWEAVKMVYHKGYKYFDFGRTDFDNKGLMGFKNRWGTTVCDLPKFYIQKTEYKDFHTLKNTNSFSHIKNLLPVLPAPVLKLIGNFCYRHLG